MDIGKITIDIENVSQERLKKYAEILHILITKGALDGVRGGKAIIHFDAQGEFQGVQLDYWPWRKRSQQKG